MRSFAQIITILIVILLISKLMELFQSIKNWSASAGVRYDILKTAIALITTLLLSPIFRVVRNRLGRNILNILVGSLLLIFILEDWSLLIFGGIVVPYILMSLFKHHFLISAVSSFFLLLYVHAYRFIFFYNVWQVDCSVYMMLLVTKLTYFGRWVENEGKIGQYSFWDYLGYNLYFPGLLAGPTFSYENYLNFIQDKRREIEKTTKYSALTPILFIIPLSAMTLYFMPIFHPRWVLQDKFYLNFNFWSKIAILNIVGFLYRVKFYTAWYFAQTSTNLSGLSLSESGEYNEVTAGNLLFQIEPNPRNKTEYWNASLQQWLKNVVYASLIKKIGPNGAFFGTFIISAFWHGIYLTYYLGFLQWGILLYLTKWAYKWTLIFPQKITNSKIFTLLTWIVSATLMNYIGMFIVVLEWRDAIAFYSDIYYCGSVVLVVLFLLSFVLRPPRQKEQKDHEN